MGSAADLAKEILHAVERDRCSFISLEIRTMLLKAWGEGRAETDNNPHAEQARELIDAERKRHDAKRGEQNHDPQAWMSILGEEFGELCQAANDMRWPKDGVIADPPYIHALAEAVQTAAVAQAIVECLLRSTWKWPRKPSAYDAAKRYAVADDSAATRRYVQFPFIQTVRGNILALSEDITADTLIGTGDECEALVNLMKMEHTSLKVVEVPYA